ncbi:protein translocase subunit SecD [Curvivirga sp.]|uniref:protein translocase subunit SecD n=1 Tax=Curvivirga sp. TaxID=2856848 RepID=UPI003B5A1A93
MLNFPLWKKALVGIVCLLSVLYAVPNFMPAGTFAGVPSWLPGKTVNLGLDLQGGAHLLFKVETEQVLKERMENVVAEMRVTLRQERLRYSGLGVRNNSAMVTLRDATQSDRFRELIREIDNRLLIDEVSEGSFALSLSEQDLKAEVDNAVSQSIEVIRRRIDEDGTKEPVIQRQGEDRILVQVPGAEDTEEVKRKVGKTAKMTFQMVDVRNSLSDAIAGRVPPGSVLLPSIEEDENGNPVQMYLVEKRVRVSGEHLTNASPSFDQANRPAVSFQFDAVGGRKFAQVTAENVGFPFAIVLDGKVISAPEIQSPIPGGSGIITGNFTVTETNELSLLLRAGALPAPLTILEERSVGPGLGQDSIDAGTIASIIGLIGVIIYMAASYGLFGLLANVALVFNISLIIAALSTLQATLTLPGIAGIVLTIGMAVDANVLIFERIREEFKSGQKIGAAIEAGYKRALTTIVDSNLTTLIAAILLFAFGAGPIKGFAVTLSIGILTSMFTAIMVTRFLVVTWYTKKKPKTLPL